MSGQTLPGFWVPCLESDCEDAWKSEWVSAPAMIIRTVVFWLLKTGRPFSQRKIRAWSGRSADFIRPLISSARELFAAWSAKKSTTSDTPPIVHSSSTHRPQIVHPQPDTDDVVEEVPSTHRPPIVHSSSTPVSTSRTRETDNRQQTTTSSPPAPAVFQGCVEEEGDQTILTALQQVAPGLARNVARCLYLIGVKSPADLQGFRDRDVLCGTLCGLRAQQSEYHCTHCDSSAKAYSRDPHPPHCLSCSGAMTLTQPRRDAAVSYLRSTSIIAVADVIERMMAAQGLRFGTQASATVATATAAGVFDRPHQGNPQYGVLPEMVHMWLRQHTDYSDLVEASRTATKEDLLRWMTPRVHGAEGLLSAAFNHLQGRQEVAA